eukprot:TRINITY_DN3038_c0_g2_i2.p1 TRINITY_DN3038_c0_g2~~TRINITY_DN3038_c0_g2_i2.p1  ORF type:complete len:134 (+),score=27.72 TRINITY_DN3038_c0_g2_i2:151-552(+)
MVLETAGAEGSIQLQQKFKAITRVLNVQEARISSTAKPFVNKYNGTPFLTRPQHEFYLAPHYFEIDIDVHKFSFMARSALGGVRDALDSVIFEFGFVVEASNDNELPEQILGAARLSKLDLDKAVEFPVEILQ